MHDRPDGKRVGGGDASHRVEVEEGHDQREDEGDPRRDGVSGSHMPEPNLISRAGSMLGSRVGGDEVQVSILLTVGVHIAWRVDRGVEESDFASETARIVAPGASAVMLCIRRMLPRNSEESPGWSTRRSQLLKYILTDS